MERDVTDSEARSDQSILGKAEEKPKAQLPPFVETVVANLVSPSETLNDKPVAVIAEPDEAARHLAGMMLEEVGYRVIEASDKETASTLIEEHAGKVALVLLDEGLPDRGGSQREQRTRESGSIVVTTPARQAAWVCRIRLLRKPWLPLDLLREAERAFSR